MTDSPQFLEIKSPVQYGELSPGMYSAGCPGRFDTDATGSLMHCSAQCTKPGLFNGTFLGIMLPYYLHNTNNLMAGVLGNIDLAGMFLPNLEKVEPKIIAARSATDSVVSFFRDIAEAVPAESCVSVGKEEIEKCLVLLNAACGRSVNSQGLEGLDTHVSLNCEDPLKAVAALNGMVAWVVVSLGGSGRVYGSSSTGRLGLGWSRPAGSGLSYMPGKENSASILAVAGGLAASAGMALVVENWTEEGGEVSLVAQR